jgi:hypothetical protein
MTKLRRAGCGLHRLGDGRRSNDHTRIRWNQESVDTLPPALGTTLDMRTGVILLTSSPHSDVGPSGSPVPQYRESPFLAVASASQYLISRALHHCPVAVTVTPGANSTVPPSKNPATHGCPVESMASSKKQVFEADDVTDCAH